MELWMRLLIASLWAGDKTDRPLHLGGFYTSGPYLIEKVL